MYQNKNNSYLLFMAHPGHELRVHHWLEIVKPHTFILTDGSGHTKKSRLNFTTEILKNTGASIGELYGDWTDADMYKIILTHKLQILFRIVNTLVEFMIDKNIDFVFGDALEGYNPSHDLCRYLLNLAVKLVEKRSERKIANYDFTLIKHPNFGEATTTEFLKLELDKAAFQRKLLAAKNYHKLQEEVNSTLTEFSEQAFTTEYLRPVNTSRHFQPWQDFPFYETYGRQQVAAGYYRELISYDNHMKPLVRALWHSLELEELS